MLRSHFVALILIALPAAAQEHSHGSTAPEQLGTVHFQTSCAPAAQTQFDRAVALLHSFDFPRAVDGFGGSVKADAHCTIAYWGIALSRWGNPFAAGSRATTQLQQGREAIERAQANPPATERERAYVEAAARLYAGYESTPQAQRIHSYRDAMAALTARYPDDTEASIFYALALAFAAEPTDKTYADQLKGGAILDSLFKRQPDHPGLAHYIIHTYDVPPLADRALEAAQRYAKIAPSASHALHMPSHTFTRLGYWRESVDTNIASAVVARREGATAEELHATDYQMYAYLQGGQDRAARQVLDSLSEIASRFDPSSIGAGAPPSAGFFAMAAIPARYALERGAWAEAARLSPQKTPFPYTEAMTHFARAIGSARGRDAVAARAEVDALGQIRDALKTSNDTYWTEQVEIQRLAATAWLALAEQRRDDALADMRAAVEREDRTEKSSVTPGPLAPARELLGDMLVELGQPAAALKEYEATLRKEPNRFRAVYGAAHAATLAGNRATAKRYFTQLLKICARADKPGRPELQEARR